MYRTVHIGMHTKPLKLMRAKDTCNSSVVEIIQLKVFQILLFLCPCHLFQKYGIWKPDGGQCGHTRNDGGIACEVTQLFKFFLHSKVFDTFTFCVVPDRFRCIVSIFVLFVGSVWRSLKHQLTTTVL